MTGHILVADDVPSIRTLVARQLENAGARVTAVGDGAKALTMAEQAARAGQPFDLYLLDIRMPQLDGLETFKRLRSAGFCEPVIVLTAGVMTGVEERCLALGFNILLAKPVERDQLLATCARLLSCSYQPPAVADADSLGDQCGLECASVGATSSGSGVLLVEDHHALTLMTRRQLESFGCAVQLAQGGKEAERLVQSWVPATVIIDMSLPDTCGLELVRRLKAQPALAESRFVAYSGHCEESDRVAASASGFDQYLVKPAQPSALMAAVQISDDGREN